VREEDIKHVEQKERKEWRNKEMKRREQGYIKGY
jgi:hypothetical protein